MDKNNIHVEVKHICIYGSEKEYEEFHKKLKSKVDDLELLPCPYCGSKNLVVKIIDRTGIIDDFISGSISIRCNGECKEKYIRANGRFLLREGWGRSFSDAVKLAEKEWNELSKWVNKQSNKWKEEAKAIMDKPRY